MAAAYSTFARQGTYIEPKTYTMVTDSNRQVLLRNESEEETILAERTTYYITEMLQQVVTGGSGATGKAANFSGQEIATAKPVPPPPRRDLWFVGYTPYYTAAVWTGYDQQERLSSSLGNPSTGLWRQVMSAVHQNLAYKDFTQPDSSNLRTVTYCLSSGDAGHLCLRQQCGPRVPSMPTMCPPAPAPIIA